ncbi:MAG: hypothetical protein H6730_27070 [Deltaproteobacteria bacterium]|nr:hypothetical protein [Deltaproteobacteria bacterium]
MRAELVKVACTLVLTGCGAGEVEGLAREEGVPKAWLGGAPWVYTRSYGPTDAPWSPSLELEAALVIQEALLVVRAQPEEVLVVWGIAGHFPTEACPDPRPPSGTNTIDDGPCLDWWERPRMTLDLTHAEVFRGDPRVLFDYAEADPALPAPVLEDGRLETWEWAWVRRERDAQPERVSIQHRLLRMQ